MTKSKTISTIVFAICGALALALIVMAIVPKSFKPEINYQPDQIMIYNGKTTDPDTFIKNSEISTIKEKYNKITDLLNNSFSTSSLNALFSGTIGNQIQYEYDTTTFSSIVSNSTFVLEYYYTDLQKMMKEGKVFTSTSLSTYVYENQELSYGKLWIAINNHTNFANVNIYVQKLNTKGDPRSTLTSSVYKLSTLGNTSALYDYLTNIKK